MKNRYAEFARPKLAGMLKKLKLDYEVLSSSGNYMQIRDSEGNQKQILDLVSGFGSCLLGHNPPELVTTLVNALTNKTAGHAQLSLREPSGMLGEHLNKIAFSETGKEFITSLVNTGAEAVEAAIKHALMAYDAKKQKFISGAQRTFSLYKSQAPSGKIKAAETLRKQWLQNIDTLFKENPPIFLALEGAFHGKTLGALSLTHNPAFRKGFETSVLKCHFLEPSHTFPESVLKKYAFTLQYPEIIAGELVFKVKQWFPFAALFAEPIQGEAGVFPLSGVQAKSLRKLCEQLEIPLIWDEIQSGCFRTGTLFAATHLNVPGDYYLLGKSLGGGLVKTAALLVAKEQYQQQFGLIHTSTFAEDDLSSLVADKFLQLATAAGPEITEAGNQWNKMLKTVGETYPKVIKEIRGAGLIWGIEFHDFFTSGYYGFQSVSRGGYFNYLLASWLFHKYGIRFSAPLSNNHTLRLHPALGCKEEELEKVRLALTEICQILKSLDFYALVSFLLPRKWQAFRGEPLEFKGEAIYFEVPVNNIPQAGFITHYIDANTLLETDPSLAGIPQDIIEDLLAKFQEMLSPVITGGRQVNTKTGEAVHLTMVGLPFTSGMVKQAMENKTLSVYRETITKAVELLETNGNPTIIGLGQYTSIIAANGLYLTPDNAMLTSGNGLTAFLTATSFLENCRKAGIDLKEEQLAVFGAGGNIGSILCALLEPFVQELVLFGNPNTSGSKKLEKVKNCLATQIENVNVTIADDISKAAGCRLVVAATSQPEPFLSEEVLHPLAVVCDVSIPSVIDVSVLENPGGRILVPGAIARMPDGKAVPTKGFPLAKGEVYACLAETLVLALAQQPELASFGELKLVNVKELGRLAQKYGFMATEKVKTPETWSA